MDGLDFDLTFWGYKYFALARRDIICAVEILKTFQCHDKKINNTKQSMQFKSNSI